MVKTTKRNFRRVPNKRIYAGGKRRAIKRWAGEKPSIVDRISKYAGAIGKVAGTVSMLTQMVNCEKKWYDKPTSNAVISNTGTDVSLYTNMAVGMTDQTRNGNVVKGKNLYGRYSLLSNSLYPTLVRLVWVLDKEYNGATAPLSDVLQQADTHSGVHMDNSKRFVILKDKLHIINPNGNSTNPQQMIKGKFYFPTDFHIHYKGTTDTQASLKENQIILYAVSNQPLASAPIITHYGRFRFYDN